MKKSEQKNKYSGQPLKTNALAEALEKAKKKEVDNVNIKKR